MYVRHTFRWLRWATAGVMVLVGLTSTANQLLNIRHSDNPRYTRVVFDLTESPQFKSDTLANPPRFYVDLATTRLHTQFKRPSFDDSKIRRVRIAERGQGLRVVFDLNEVAKPELLVLAPNGPNRHRLVVDFLNDVETSCVVEHDRDVVVVLDAGHGGEDPGAIAVNGAQEKHITLSIAQKVRARIERQPGFKVVMTRDRDYEIPLENRYQMAQNLKARLFVSIHADAFRTPQPKGATAYVLSQGRAESELARWLVKNENRSDWVGGVSAWVDSSCHEARDKLKFLNAKVRQEALADAVELGKKILHKIDLVAEVHPRSFDRKAGEYRVSDAGFVVLKATAVPSLLVETGFLSNPEEARLLSTRQHQNRIAGAIADTILQHFCESPPQYTDLAEGKVQCDLEVQPVVYQVRRGDSLSVIAQREAVSVRAIRMANGLNSDRIYIGQKLTIPIPN